MNAQVQGLIAMMRAAIPADAPRMWQLPVAEARRRGDAFFAMLNHGGPEMAERRDLTIPGRRGAIPARLYVPRNAGAASPGLLYLHGGGFVIGSPDTHDRLTRELAAGIGARVLSLHYALAPEHPYPAGLDDCVDASRWLGAHARELGTDPARLLIGGDSAGANLSAATILTLRDDRAPVRFRAVLLLYGRFTHEDTPAITAWGTRDLVLSRHVMDWFKDHYVGDRGRAEDPYLNPLVGDLHHFPPSILVVGTLDPLLDDSRLFAAALEKAGVRTELHVYEDGLHAFAQFSMLDMCAEALAKLSAFAILALAAPQSP
ncbi:MAG: alpha/beta hydrolase [Candidatus Rokubacteria bacterium]|nr:alpha/beta hydrolase [Candidatus Rokubacteria bacterium]